MEPKGRMGKGILVVASMVFASIPAACQIQPESPPIASGAAESRIGIDYLWYGINQYSKEPDLPVLTAYRSDLDAGIVRFDIYWNFIQPGSGAFDWAMTDAIMGALPPDARLLFTLYCTAPWAIQERRDDKGRPVTTILPSTAPIDYDDYYRFVHALAERYSGRVGYYQIENEVYGARGFWAGSPAEYLDLLRTGHDAVEAADPEARVLPAGIAFGTIDVARPVAPAYRAAFDFIDLVYSSGKEHFDIADVHLYYTLESVSDRLGWLRSLMAAKGYSKPVWASEIGGLDSRAYGDHANGAEQSIDLVKRYVLAFAGSAEKVFWLSVHRAKDEEALPWADMALTEDPAALIKKPAYHTLRLLNAKIGNFSAVAAIDGGYEFTVGGKTVLILWREAPAVVDASAHFGSSSVLVTRIVTAEGNPLPQVSRRPANAIPVDRVPIFVESADD